MIGMTVSRILRALVLALATARLSRFITSDTLGEWIVREPANEWAAKHDAPQKQRLVYDDDTDAGPDIDPRDGWRSKLVSGLGCPFCVGFWLGLVVLAASALTRVPVLGKLIRFAGFGLALNYVVGHVSSRLD